MTKNRKGSTQRRKTGKKQGKVVPMKPKRNLKLNEDERIRFENLTLKIQLVQSEAQQKATPLVDARVQLSRAIGARLGVQMDAYNIVLDTGALVPNNGEVEPTLAEESSPVDEEGEPNGEAQSSGG